VDTLVDNFLGDEKINKEGITSRLNTINQMVKQAFQD
jgi:hypothetical protein